MVLLVGIVGFLGSGKNAVSNAFVRHGFTHESFARPLKDACASMFSWPRDMLDGVTPASRKWREAPDAFWSTQLGKPFTPRMALQWLGTDVMRRQLHKDVWLLSLLKRVAPHTQVVITDVRFTNEIQAIKALGGVIIRVQRGSEPEWFDTAVAAAHGSTAAADFMRDVAAVHTSEWEWLSAAPDFDYVIHNNGSMALLHRRTALVIKDILRHQKKGVVPTGQ